MHSTKQASFIVSDGTKGAVAPGHYAVLMREALQASFPRAGHVACNPFPGRPSDALGPCTRPSDWSCCSTFWGYGFPFVDRTANAHSFGLAWILIAVSLARALCLPAVSLAFLVTAGNEAERILCGATNVQGRHMNGAPNPCTVVTRVDGSPLTASGRFLHVEQAVRAIGTTLGLSKARPIAIL